MNYSHEFIPMRCGFCNEIILEFNDECDCAENFELIKTDKFWKNKKTMKVPILKNLILKKSLPSVYIDGIEYKRPKGTIYWSDGDGGWSLLKENDIRCIDLDDYEKNKDWYGLTIKDGTYKFIYINNEKVEFVKSGITVGCVDISNEEIREIAKLLKD